MWAPKVEELEALQLETRYFLDCVKDGTKPFNDGQAGLRVVRILEAAEQSLKQHKEVALRCGSVTDNSVYLVHRVGLVQPSKRDRPDKPDRPQ